MFLKISTAFFILAFSLSSWAQSKPIAALELGGYVLVSGNQNLCGDFNLREKHLRADTLIVSVKYNFSMKNEQIRSNRNNCLFTQTSTRQDKGIVETILQKNTSEVCGTKVRSRATEKLIISRGELILQLAIDNGQPVEYRWKKKEI